MSMLKGLKLPRRGDRDSSTAAGKPPVVKIKKAQANELAILISRLQKNADQVEKDIIDTEDKLAIDIKNLENGREFQYRAKNAENLSRAEGTLKDLFLDSEQVKQLKHPQGEMINKDIHQLHDRWSKLCAEYRQVYEQVNIPNMRPQVDWLKMVGEKRYSLNRKGFGSDLVTVEMQMAEHNIIHKEIEAYGPHVKAAEGDPEYLRRLNEEYATLLTSSTKRQKDLNELHTYMQRCTRELMWLDSEQEERKGMDWSDRNLDYDVRTRKYENIVNNELVAKEASINQIQDEGEKLLAAKHPAKPTIEAHMDAVENDWKRYLNLLICEEAHLKFMTEHHKFNKDVKESNEWLTKQSADMKRRYTVDPNDSALRVEELLKEVQEKEKEMDAYEKNVVALKNRATQMVPLKYRREKIPKPLTVETLCDYEDGELVLHRGDKYTLKDNSDKENWVVSNSAGKTETVPSACFVIPPTDPDSIALVDGISTQFSELKQKRRETEAALRKRAGDVKQQAGQVLAADNSEERECVKHISDLERIYYELDDQEQQMLVKLRTPLDKNRPAEDGASRLREQDAILKRLQVLNTEKAKVQKSAEAFLSRKPKCPSAPKLRQKLDETDAKYTRVSLLANNYGDKAKAASSMEVSLQKAEGAIAPLERSLALEQSIPTDLAGIRARRKELEAVKKDIGAKKALVLEEPARNLQSTQQHCQNVARNFNERCPDVERQESEVNRLRQRFGNMGDQTNLRLKELDNAEKAYSNYRGTYDNLNSWLDNVPKPSVSQNETVESINAKIADQKRLADELRRKETEKNKVEQLANDYQSTVRNYETASDRYRTLVEPELVNGVNWDTNKSSPTRQVQDEERQLVKKFAEVSAANQQQIVYLQNMQNIVKNPPVQEVQARMSQQNLQKSQYSGPSKHDLELIEEEKKKRLVLEKDMESLKRQLDVAQQKAATPAKDPAAEQEAIFLRQQLQQEAQNKEAKDEELRLLRDRLQKSERAMQEAAQKVIIKEVSKVEKDPSKEREVNDLRNQMADMTRQIEEEQNKRSSAEKSIVMYERRIKEIEQQGPRVEKQVTIKEVPKIQQDPLLLKDLEEARRMLEQETAKNKASEEELRLLRQRYSTLENTKPKVEVKEVLKEVVKADPNTEKQAADLKRQLEMERQKNDQMNKEMVTLRTDLMTIQNRKPEVQVKEVVKLEKDPEVMRNLSAIQQQLEEEISKKTSAEKRVYMLENKIKNFEEKPPVVEEKAIIKEVFKVETDPQTTKELANLKQMLDEEFEKNKVSKKEILTLQQKYTALENTKPKVELKEVIKEVVRADPETERQAADLKKQLAEEKRKSEKADRELDALRIDVEALRNRKPEVQVKEVVKVEKDPEVVRELNKVKQQLEDEIESRKATEKKYVLIERRIKEVEQAPPKIEERLVIKEVAKVERDPKLEEEVVSLRKQLQQEIQRSKISQEEIQTIQHKFVTLENTKPKVEIKEVIKEVVRADPETERQAADLKKQLAEEKRKSEKADRELDALRIDVEALRNRKPEVQVKEVVKVEKDPEVVRELNKVKQQLEDEVESRKATEKKYVLIERRIKEVEQAPPKVEERIVIKEVTKVEKDPQTEQDLVSLKRKLEDEIQRNQVSQKEISLLQQKYMTLENTKPKVEIKEITKEVVRADPETERQAAELRRQLADEKRTSDKAEKDLSTLRRELDALKNKKPEVQVKEVVKVERDPEQEREIVKLKNTLENERKKKSMAEEENDSLQQKILMLENRKPKVEIKEVVHEILKADPQTEKEAAEYKRQLEQEKRKLKDSERELASLRTDLNELRNRKPDVQIKEVVKVQRDPEQDKEISKLTKSLDEESRRNRKFEDEIHYLKESLTKLENTKPKVEIKEVVKEVVKADPETERQAVDLKRKLTAEKERYDTVMGELNTLRIELNSLRNRKPDVQIKEVVKLERDPELERELKQLKHMYEEEIEKNRDAQRDLVSVRRQYTILEKEKPKVEIQEVLREVVRPDPETEKEASELRLQMMKIKGQLSNAEREALKLREEVKTLQNRKPEIQVKEVLKETVKFEKNPAAEEEVTRMKKELDREMQKRTDAELQLTKLQNKIFNLENQPPKIEEKVVIQESIQYKTDPNLEREVDSLKQSLNQEKKRQQSLEEDLGQLRSTVSEQKQLITQLRMDSQEKNELEQELRRTKNRMTTLEQQKSKVEEKVVYKEVVKVEQDPEVMKEAVLLRSQLNDERSKRNRLEDEVDRMKARMHDLEIEATKEKIVYKEVVKIEKDKMVDSELEKLRSQLDDELRIRRNKERELQKQSEVITDVQSEIEKLKRKLTDTDKVINSKEGEIVALRDKLSRLENRQPEVTRTSTEKTQSHLSRKIVVMDPETGKEMTPYEAYKLDLIDWKTYSQLAGQECDWEEVSVSGPKGISSSLRDKKTGTKFSIEDALASGKVTQQDVQQYKNRKMTIAEFAAKVSGQTFKPQPEKEEGVKKTNSSQVSSSLQREPAQSKDFTVLDLETPPIAGVFDVDTNQKMQIKTATSKNLIDPITAQKLLEAQAATGGIIDVANGEKYSVHKAADMNLIDSSSVQRLLGAQKAYTGIEDPTTKERLPVGIALKRGWLYQDAAYKYLEAQFLTGGLVDPNKAGRVPVGEALALGIIDNEAKRALEDDKSHPKDITDPISKKRLTYKEALNQCKVESSTGLPLLKVSSKSSGGSSRFTR